MLLHSQFHDFPAIVGLACNKGDPNLGIRVHGTASRLDQMVTPPHFALTIVKLHASDAPAFVPASGASRVARTKVLQATFDGGVSAMPNERANTVRVLNINEGKRGRDDEPED